MRQSRMIVMAAAAYCALACAKGESENSTAQAGSKDSASQSGPVLDTVAARNTIQAFYDWYAPLAVADSLAKRSKPWWKAMKPEYLSPGLIAALRVDSVHQFVADDPHEALEGDPILHAPEPCAPYKVTESRGGGMKAIVTVVRACDPDDRDLFDLEVMDVNGRLVISDIIWPSGSVRESICREATRGDTSKRESACPWLKQP
jgi:hypothetical protein